MYFFHAVAGIPFRVSSTFEHSRSVSDKPQIMGGLFGANKGHTRKSYKLSAGLRTQSVECSKLGKTRIITDASCGMVRNTGFCGQNLPPHVYLELLSIYF